MPDNSKNELDELLSAYVDGELTVEERALVEERLRTDPRAAQLVEELRSLSSAIKSLPRETLGRDLRASIQAEALQAKADADQRNVLPMIPHDRWANYRRGLAWSAITIAAALTLMFVQPKETDDEIGELAKAARKAETDRANRRSNVAGDAALPPVGEMRAAKPPQGAVKRMLADEALAGKLEEDKSPAQPAALPFAPPATVELALKSPDGLSRFNRLLAEHNIQLESQPAESTATTRDKLTEAEASGADQSGVARAVESAAPAAIDGWGDASGDDARIEVLVEASPEQINELVFACQSETETFAAVSAPQSRSVSGAVMSGGKSPAAEEQIDSSDRSYDYGLGGRGGADLPGQSSTDEGKLLKNQPSSGRAWRLPLPGPSGELNGQSTLDRLAVDQLAQSGVRAGAAGKEASKEGQVQVLFVFRSSPAPATEPVPAVAAPSSAEASEAKP